jgi:ssDNA-binding replication factor A large subunit
MNSNVYIATSVQNFQISGVKHGDDWTRRELTIADDFGSIVVKFWNDATNKLDDATGVVCDS